MRDLRAEVDRSWAASAIAARTRNALAEEAARLQGKVEKARREAATVAALVSSFFFSYFIPPYHLSLGITPCRDMHREHIHTHTAKIALLRRSQYCDAFVFDVEDIMPYALRRCSWFAGRPRASAFGQPRSWLVTPGITTADRYFSGWELMSSGPRQRSAWSFGGLNLDGSISQRYSLPTSASQVSIRNKRLKFRCGDASRPGSWPLCRWKSSIKYD